MIFNLKPISDKWSSSNSKDFYSDFAFSLTPTWDIYLFHLLAQPLKSFFEGLDIFVIDWNNHLSRSGTFIIQHVILRTVVFWVKCRNKVKREKKNRESDVSIFRNMSIRIRHSKKNMSLRMREVFNYWFYVKYVEYKNDW